MKGQRQPMRFLLMIALLCGLADTAWAEIYRWTDADGVMHFADNPPAEIQAERIRVAATPADPVAPAVALPVERPVVMYSAAWCSVCKMARAYFDFHAIPFEEFDVETTERGQRDYQRLKGNGVPLILVGNRRLDGFTAAGFDELYQR